jgi:hypothetical protein
MNKSLRLHAFTNDYVFVFQPGARGLEVTRVDMERFGATVHGCVSPRSASATRGWTVRTEVTSGTAVSTGSGNTLKLITLFLN